MREGGSIGAMRARRAAFGIGALWTALALTLAGALTARAQSQPPAVQVVHAFQDAWNSGRVERVLALFA